MERLVLENIAFLKDKGLHHAIDYRDNDWKQELMQLTNGRGVDLISDPIGGKSLRDSYKALSNTGRLGMFGISHRCRRPVSRES